MYIMCNCFCIGLKEDAEQFQLDHFFENGVINSQLTWHRIHLTHNQLARYVEYLVSILCILCKLCFCIGVLTSQASSLSMVLLSLYTQLNQHRVHSLKSYVYGYIGNYCCNYLFIAMYIYDHQNCMHTHYVKMQSYVSTCMYAVYQLAIQYVYN